MARNGKPPMPHKGSWCRACIVGVKDAMNDGLFCVDHELLWIAKAGVTSNNLHRKHGKMYRQFIKQQTRDAHMERNRGILRGMIIPHADRMYLWSTNVHPTALRDPGKSLQGRPPEADVGAGPEDLARPDGDGVPVPPGGDQ